jgi:hypothetical protein
MELIMTIIPPFQDNGPTIKTRICFLTLSLGLSIIEKNGVTWLRDLILGDLSTDWPRPPFPLPNVRPISAAGSRGP